MRQIPEGIQKKLNSFNLFDKLSYYREKYGLVHSLLSYLGRYNFRLWTLVGALATTKYKNQYLATHDPKIINLGGGGNCLQGCLTSDITPRADIYVDITKKLPLEDNSIDYIFCEEAIEHIDLNNGYSLLKECLRVLKKGGVLRVATPDLDWFATQLNQSVESCHQINEIFYQHEHRYLYTKKSSQAFCGTSWFR